MSLLGREEYVEQAYFFRVLREWIDQNVPVQEVLLSVREEVLVTTKLPMAIDFLVGELQLRGRIGDGMSRLKHYFTEFQAFIMRAAEDERSKLDFRIALQILEKEADYLSQNEMNLAALFMYHFECVARNRLGYDEGMLAIAEHPAYPEAWRSWIGRIRFELGTVDFSDLVYVRSEQHVADVAQRRREPDYQPAYAVLFDRQAGRIAKANHGKDPLYMFAALHRQLGYPAVPRPKPKSTAPLFDPPVENRFQRLESRVALLEQEQRGGLDLTSFYKKTELDSDEGSRNPE